jgi:multidrug efflux pump subunit AcrB
MLPDISVRKPYLIVVFIVIIAILGGVAYFNMPVDLLPNMNLPYIAIVIISPGSSPEDVERTISSPVEQAMATIDNVKRITSNSNEHYSMVLMEFNGKVDLNSATIDIQSNLVKVKSDFPDMTMEPMILKLDPSMLPVMNIAVSEKGKTINESSEYLESIGNELLSVEGVAQVGYDGLIDNLVLVMLNNEKLTNSIKEQLTPDRMSFVDEEAYQQAVANTPEGEPLPDKDDYVDEDAYNGALANAQAASEIVGKMIAAMLQPELIGKALYAQNFNMPAGNIEIDGISYLVKIGDKINSYNSLKDMSILSIDFKSVIGNYEQIIDALRNISVSQATLDTLKSLSDPDGIAKSTLWEMMQALTNLEDNPLFEKIQDPDTGETVYIINSAFTEGFEALGPIAEQLDEFVLTAESLNTVEIIDELIEFFDNMDNEELVADLNELKNTLISIRQTMIGGGILQEQVRLDESGNPVIDPVSGEPIVDYVFSPALLELLRSASELGDTLEEIEVTEERIIEIQHMLSGIYASLDDISAFAMAVEDFLKLPFVFNMQYLTDDQGNYLDANGNITDNPAEYVIVSYKINTAFIDLLELLPPLTLKVNQIADAVTLDTSCKEFSIVNGIPGVMLSIQKQSDISTVTVSKGVKAKIAEMADANPDLEYIVLMDQGEYVVYMINTIIKNLLYGALFAIIILFLFLKRIKPTFIVGSSIFISVVAAFVLMYFSGISLNIISMGGLALGVGMLVDNSIVVIENIYRLREEGEGIFASCVKGAKQVSGAIISSTLTTVIIFLPIAFIEGITKQIFSDIGLTIAFSLGASLFVALTFVPMAASGMLKKEKSVTESVFFIKMKNFYAKSMEFFLNKKWIVIISVSVLFFGSVLSVFFMNRIFFPPSDMGFITVTATVKKDKLPDGVSYEDATRLIVDYLDLKIKEKEYVEDIGIQVTSGMSMYGIDAGGEYISANVVLKEGKRKPANSIIEDLVKELKVIPGLPEDSYTIRGSSESVDMGFVDDSTLTFFVYGEELDDMRQAAKELALLLSKVEGVNKEKVNSGVGVPPMEYQLHIDPYKAAPYGIYVAQALQTMQTLLKEPEACTTVKFDSTRLNYDVIVYGSEYKLDRWYMAHDKDMNVHKVYINYDDTYYTVIDGEIVEVNRVFKGVKPTNQFTFTHSGTEYQLTGESNNMIIYYSVGRINDIDLVTFEINSVVLPGTELEYSISVPLYKILKDESFLTDENGNILYRIKEDEDGMPVYLKDEHGNVIEDENGNPVPDYVRDEDGNKIPVGIAMKEGYLSVAHDNGVRRTTVTIGLKPGANTDRVLDKCLEVIKGYSAPEGVSIDVEGENPIITEAYKTLIVVLILGVMLVYLVMVAQFQSLKSPMIVMFTVPLAFTGSVFAMLIAFKPISVVALVGLVLLMGIVVNNGIVFVDYVNQLIAEGMDRKNALIKAGRDRIRPILMTALTTIFGLLIMAFDNSAQGAMMQPMAIATIGGMVYATLLTIYFVPIMFDIFNKKKGNTGIDKGIEKLYMEEKEKRFDNISDIEN